MKQLPQTIREDLKAQASTIGADLEWKNNTQNELLSQLDFSNRAEPSKVVLVCDVLSTYVQNLFSVLSRKTVAVSIIMLAIIVGPGLATVSAARASLPGDMLYPIKRQMERAQISIVFTANHKAQMEMDFVANRLNELHRLTQEQAPSEERDKNIEMALIELKRDTINVNIRLESVKNEKGAQDEAVVELAKSLEQRTLDYKQTLVSAVAGMDDDLAEESGNDIEQALMVVQDIALGALDILVQNHESEGENVTTEDKEELNSRIQNQIDTTKEIIKSLADRVDGDETLLEEEETDDVAEEDTSDTDENTEEEVVADEELPADAEEETNTELRLLLQVELLDNISYAEDLLELDDFSEALDVLSSTKIQVDEVASQISDDEDESQIEEPVDNIDESEEGISEEIVNDGGQSEEESLPDSTE